MARLVECEFLEWEHGGSLITLRFGGRTKDIVTSYRESIGKKAA